MRAAEAAVRQEAHVGPRFTLFVSGQFVNMLGDFAAPIVVSALLLQTGMGSQAIALSFAGRTVGLLVGLPLANLLIDSMSKVRLMLLADLGRGVSAALLFPVIVHRSAPGVFLLMVVAGFSTSFFLPAFRSMVPLLVASKQIRRANSTVGSVTQLALIAGPALGGSLFAWFGRDALWFNVITFVASVGTLALLRLPAEPLRDASSSLAERALGGLRYVRSKRWLAMLIGMGILQMALAVVPWNVFAPTISTDRFGGIHAYATAMTVYAVGGVIGAYIGGRVKFGHPAVIGALGPAVFSVAPLSFALSSSVVVIAAAHLMAGLALQFSGVALNSAIHESVPADVLGRVMVLSMLGSSTLTPLAYLLLSGTTVDPRTALECGAAAAALICILVAVMPAVTRLRATEPAS